MISLPIVWLGQSVDTSSICSNYSELKNIPFLTSLGCAIRKPSLRRSHFHASLRIKLGASGPLMIDSGGFALMMNPKSRWTVRDVIDLIRQIDADIFVSLDHPPSRDDTANRRKSKILASSKNFAKLLECFPNKIIMPVVHGRTPAEIELSIQSIKRCRSTLPWIGLGGIVPLLQNRRVSPEITRKSPELFIAETLLAIRSAFPSANIHAFGAGGTRTFPALFAFGAHSADSIGWRQAAGFGSLFLPLRSQRAVGSANGAKPPRKLLDASDLVQLEACRCPVCVEGSTLESRLSTFRRSFHSLSIHNAWTLVNQYQYWPNGRNEMLALVARGELGKTWARVANSLYPSAFSAS